MKIALNEKQYDLLLSNLPDDQEISEIDSPTTAPSSTSSASTTTIPTNNVDSKGVSSSGDKTGYPTVSTWADIVGSKLTRGPGNQIANTKWSDIVGSLISRGPSNQLSEQIIGTTGMGLSDSPPNKKMDTPKQQLPPGEADINDKENVDGYKAILTPSGYATYVPLDSTILSIADAKDLNPKNFKSILPWLDPKRGGTGRPETDRWVPIDFKNQIKLGSVMSFKTNGITYSAVITNPQLNVLKSWDDFYRLDPNPDGWKFTGYFDTNNSQYISPKKPELSFWSEWGETIVMVVTTIVISIASVGIAGILELSVAAAWATEATLQAGYMIYLGARDLQKGNTFGGALCFLFAALPVVGKFLRIGMVSSSVASSLATKIGANTVQSAEQLSKNISNAVLTREEDVVLKKILSLTPQDLKIVQSKYIKELELKLAEKGTTLKNIKVPILKKHVTRDLGFQLTTIGGANTIHQYGISQEKAKVLKRLLVRTKTYTVQDIQQVDDGQQW